LRRVRRAHLIGWLFVAPAVAMYAIFVLLPLLMTFQYSLYRWDGIGPSQWVGLRNYVTVVTNSDLLGVIFNAFKLIVFFSFIPVTLGLLVASVMRRVATGKFGTVSRTVLFLPQIIPLVAAGIVWKWVLSTTGVVNQLLTAIGLGDLTRAWLGDFDTALPGVGVIGAWVLIGLCTVLLLTGMSKIDPALFESARIDGAGAIQEFRSITVPSLRQEIGVCLTVTVIAALAAFDIVYIATGGGPGLATTVPGLQIYQLAFAGRQVGLASALAVVLFLLVLACVLPIQRLTREENA
jgi:raffinose/stachyose/melibiose transport system permease protein